MPNRILRDWTDSEKIKKVSVYGERFFTRLIMKADDHGCFHADASLLKANLFPFLLDEVREADISRWMAECQKAGLIVLYEFSGKKYLQIQDFRQRLDKAKAKFPSPPTSTDSITNATDSISKSNDFPVEAEADIETESETETEARGAPAGFSEQGLTNDIESDLLKNQKILEAICMAAGRDMKTALISLKKYHLHMQEKEQYPKAKAALTAGFQKWLMNENSSNGKQIGKGTAHKTSASTSGHTGL